MYIYTRTHMYINLIELHYKRAIGAARTQGGLASLETVTINRLTRKRIEKRKQGEISMPIYVETPRDALSLSLFLPRVAPRDRDFRPSRRLRLCEIDGSDRRGQRVPAPGSFDHAARTVLTRSYRSNDRDTA